MTFTPMGSVRQFRRPIEKKRKICNALRNFIRETPTIQDFQLNVELIEHEE